MGLVDLRGQENDPDVRALISLAHTSPESLEQAVTRYRDGDWVLMGWEVEGEVVACAGVERLSSSEVGLLSVAVSPEHRGQGVGRALIDTLADVAAARRLSPIQTRTP